MLYCQDYLWEPPARRQENPRLFPAIRRDSPEWAELYGLRQTVERFFKSKEGRRLNALCVRAKANGSIQPLNGLNRSTSERQQPTE